MIEPLVVSILREFRQAILAMENEQAERLARHWLEIEKVLHAEISLLTLEIAERIGDDPITAQMLRRLERYRGLLDAARRETARFLSDFALPDIERMRHEYAALGARAGADAISASYLTRIAPMFHRLDDGAIETLILMLDSRAPLGKLLAEAYPAMADAVTRSLLTGFAQGLSPRQVAEQTARALGIGLDRILLSARTEQLRAYRMATTEQYRQSGVVTKFKRLVTKDDRTCLACLASDGEEFDVASELSDHPRGRCAAVPVVRGVAPPQWENARDWFERLTEETQREIMGNARFELWRSGAVDWSDFRRTHHSKIWGDSPRVASLQELRGNE